MKTLKEKQSGVSRNKWEASSKQEKKAQSMLYIEMTEKVGQV